MSEPMSPAIYMRKAQRALESARLLLDAGDTEGACSRAYYAMFDAAHAVLMAAGIETGAAEIKSHNGLLAVFNKEFRQAQRIEIDLSKALNQVQQLRQLADYSADPPERDKAQWAVEQAEVFVASIRRMLAIRAHPIMP